MRVLGRTVAGTERCSLTGRPSSATPDPLAGGPRAALAAEQALAPLADLARVANGLGVRAAVVVLPDGPGEAPAAGGASAVRWILAAAADAGLRACDGAAALAADPAIDRPNVGPAGAGAGPFLTPGGALTRAGHVRLAETLTAFLLAPPAR